jgi:hypothetical protein
LQPFVVNKCNFSDASTSKTKQKAMEKREKARLKREAKREKEKAIRADKRLHDPQAKPCKACGGWDHARSSSSNCPGYKPKRAVASDLKLTCVIKASLDSCCENEMLKQTMREAVATFRNASYVASLFMNYLVIDRLANNLDIPSISSGFIYQVFCQVIGAGKSAPSWVKDMYTRFAQLVPASLKQNLQTSSEMLAVCENDYATNVVNHVVKCFEKKKPLNTSLYVSVMKPTAGTSAKQALQIGEKLRSTLTQKRRKLKQIGQS